MKRRSILVLVAAAVSAGAAFAQSQVTVTKTVGTAPGVCAPTSAIQIPPGAANVTYCYRVVNAGGGNVTYVLTDDKLGVLAANATVGAGSTTQLLVDTTVNGSITNIATLTVGGVPVSTAAAQVGLGGADVPTLTDLGLVALGLALAAAGVVVMRNRAI
jgi:hypothetical protein